MDPSKGTQGAPRSLPTGGEVVGWLVSALRFADLRAGTGAFSESTAKRVARADGAVSDEMRSKLLHALVDRFFSERYLASRGLDPVAAREHNTLVLAGLEGALSTWDAFVGLRNSIDREYAAGVDMAAAVEVFSDITPRIAAYLARFRKIVPASRFAWQWCSKPGIQMAFQLLLERSNVTPSDKELLRSSRIARNTLRDLKSGKAIPQEETILRLAGAFAKCDVESGDGHRVDELGLEVELRLACLVASVQSLLDPANLITVGLFIGPGEVAFLASDLRRYDASALAEIITQGMRWSRWPEVHERLKAQVIEPRLVSMIARIEADADKVHKKVCQFLSEGNESAAWRLMGDVFHAQARKMRGSMTHLHGWEKGMGGDLHRMLEDMGSFWESLAEGRKPPRCTASIDTMKAKGLCDHAIAPWLDLSQAEKSRLYEQAVETDPACAHVRMRAGMFFSEDPGRVDDAIRHLRAAMMLDPEETLAHTSLAVLLWQRGLLEEALSVIEAVATRPGASTMAVLLRGSLLIALERIAEAEGCFVSILDREPNNSPALAGRADVCQERGDRVGEARFRRLAALHGGSRPVRAFPKVG